MTLRQVLDDLDDLNRCLHEQPDGRVGGPLHIITDDGNIRDSDVAYCWRSLNTGDPEKNAIVRVLCREILQLLLQLTESQRMVWCLRSRIQALGINDVVLAEQVRGGVVDPQTNGLYDARIMFGKKIVWEGLEQLEALSSVRGR
jgi:hypothetical protein